jgi:hypothetical protein
VPVEDVVVVVVVVAEVASGAEPPPPPPQAVNAIERKSAAQVRDLKKTSEIGRDEAAQERAARHLFGPAHAREIHLGMSFLAGHCAGLKMHAAQFAECFCLFSFSIFVPHFAEQFSFFFLAN